MKYRKKLKAAKKRVLKIGKQVRRTVRRAVNNSDNPLRDLRKYYK